MAGRVAGRVALVTGASSGLGKQFAKVLGAEGAKVVVAARRKERLDDLVAELGSDTALAVQCDVTDEAAVVAMYDAAEAKFGVVDTIINNAGMTHEKNALTQDIEEFRKIMDLNVTSVWCVAREGARRLIKAGADVSARGRVVNIASMAGRIIIPNVSAYNASKAACAHLTRSLAREWARYGINVNGLSPGYVETELTSDWLNGEGGQKYLQKFPRRRVMDEQSLDEALLFLCSDASKFVTGTDVLVDDAQSMG
ncbi:MAG TPA: SDR family oxidoreductase [Hyphomonadaceae bacterium]|nr:SDR family oxidoreductase [Hyphomonadaceae bacterium]HPN06865.1 SDR family oxidoreductase [Hyphomonadaceae bacterium]